MKPLKKFAAVATLATLATGGAVTTATAQETTTVDDIVTCPDPEAAQAEIDRLNEEIAALEIEKAEAANEARLERVQGQIDDAAAERDRLQAELDAALAANEEAAALAEELENTEAYIANREYHLNEYLEGRYADALQKYEDGVAAEDARVAEAQTALEAAEAGLERAITRVGEKEEALAAAQEDLRIHENLVVTRTQELADARANYDEVVADAEANKEALTDEFAVYGRGKIDREAIIADLKEEAQALRDRIAELGTLTDEEIAALEAELLEARKAVARYTDHYNIYVAQDAVKVAAIQEQIDARTVERDILAQLVTECEAPADEPGEGDEPGAGDEGTTPVEDDEPGAGDEDTTPVTKPEAPVAKPSAPELAKTGTSTSEALGLSLMALLGGAGLVAGARYMPRHARKD